MNRSRRARPRVLRTTRTIMNGRMKEASVGKAGMAGKVGCVSGSAALSVGIRPDVESYPAGC